MSGSGEIILAIESAVAGGSISLLNGDVEIGNWIGDGQVSRAEEILPNVDSLLSKTGMRRGDIGMIAVAAGPGSFTGIRIGIATALGLKNGLGVRLASRSTLKAMAFVPALPGRIGVVLPMGRNTFCFQEFENGSAVSDPSLRPDDDLTSLLADNADSKFLLHESVYRICTEHGENVVNFGTDLAFAVGMLCRTQPEVVEPPIFLSKTF